MNKKLTNEDMDIIHDRWPERMLMLIGELESYNSTTYSDDRDYCVMRMRNAQI